MRSTTELSLHEQITLLALRDQKGTVRATDRFEFVLGAALMADLLLRERAALDAHSEKKKLIDLLDASTTGDLLLDECLLRVKQAKRRATLDKWISRFSGLKRLRHRSAESLCRRGILRMEEGKVLLIFSRKTYPEVDSRPEKRIIETLRRAIFTGARATDPQTVALVSLAHHGQVLKNVFEKNDLRARKTRIKEIIAGEPTGKAARKLIDAARAATAVVTTALLIATLATPVAAEPQELRHTTEHLIITWTEGAVSDAGLSMAEKRGEEYYAAIKELLGHEPKSKVMIHLGGNAEQPDRSWEYPRVDSFGRILLFRYTPEPESYFNALAHEMVHVFRFHRRPHHDWFLEEGFAEFVALRLDPSLDGFPWYGFPVNVVAGQWIARGEDVPLTLLRERHRDLNLPCKAQSYSLRSAFFKYLGDTFGDEAVLKLAIQEDAGKLDDYEEFFGKPLEALLTDWRKSLMQAYRDTKGVETLADRYRKSPVQYMPVCRKGEDFE